MVAFEGNRFSGEIITALRDAQEKGIIRVIDLLVIKKYELHWKCRDMLSAFPSR